MRWVFGIIDRYALTLNGSICVGTHLCFIVRSIFAWNTNDQIQNFPHYFSSGARVNSSFFTLNGDWIGCKLYYAKQTTKMKKKTHSRMYSDAIRNNVIKACSFLCSHAPCLTQEKNRKEKKLGSDKYLFWENSYWAKNLMPKIYRSRAESNPAAFFIRKNRISS